MARKSQNEKCLFCWKCHRGHKVYIYNFYLFSLFSFTFSKCFSIHIVCRIRHKSLVFGCLLFGNSRLLGRSKHLVHKHSRKSVEHIADHLNILLLLLVVVIVVVVVVVVTLLVTLFGTGFRNSIGSVIFIRRRSDRLCKKHCPYHINSQSTDSGC